MYTSIEQLSPINKLFASYIKNNNLIAELNLDMSKNPYLEAMTLYPISSYPQFISQEVIDNLERCSEVMHKLIERLIRHYCNEHPLWLEQSMGIDVDLINRSFTKNCLEHFCSRFDLNQTSEGFKILEINSGACIGGWDIKFQEQAFKSIDSLQSFFSHYNIKLVCRNPLISLIASIYKGIKKLENFKDGEVAHAVFFVSDAHMKPQIKNFLTHLLANIAYECNANMRFSFALSKDELNPDKDEVYFRDKVVHALLFPNRIWDPSHYDLPDSILNAWFNNKLILPENPISNLIGDKRWLALLWNARESPIFTTKEKDLINEFIIPAYTFSSPVGSSVSDQENMTDELLQSKENYVLKPGVGFQGDDVFVGKYTSQIQWQAAVEAAKSNDNMIAQKYAQPCTVLGKDNNEIGVFNAVWGMFVIGSSYSGLWARVDRVNNEESKGVINCAKGATEAIVFEV